MKLEDVAGQRSLSTDEKCLAYLEQMRWPGGVRCPECNGSGISQFQAKGKTGKVRHLYQCLDKTCRYQFSATTGTIFHDSHLPLNKWFSAIALLCDTKRSLSINQLRVELGVQYKTAAHVAGRVRQAQRQGSIELKAAKPLEHQPPITSTPALPVATVPRAPARPAGLPFARPLPAPDPLAGRRNATAQLLSQVAPAQPSSTTVDNMLSMFVSLTQISVKPPLVFVNYLRRKVFT